jgi:hypothetical protein
MTATRRTTYRKRQRPDEGELTDEARRDLDDARGQMARDEYVTHRVSLIFPKMHSGEFWRRTKTRGVPLKLSVKAALVC